MDASRRQVGDERSTTRSSEGAHVVEMQRSRLLSGLCEVLAEEGLAHASVGSICKHAGVSRRTFYDLFDDREACFVALLEETVQRLSTEMARSGQPGSASRQEVGSGIEAAWRERVRAALAVVLAFFDDHPALARACLLETMKGGATVLRLRQRVLVQLVAAIERDAPKAPEARPPALTGQAIVGGAISVVQTRLLEHDPQPLVELLNPLMSTIVLPYLGAAAARREAERPTPAPGRPDHAGEHESLTVREPFRDLPLRLTFRTARVLETVHEYPGANNRQVGAAAGISDQGQISKLLRRLANYGLVQNSGLGHTRGEPNSWVLTQRGQAIRQAMQTPGG